MLFLIFVLAILVIIAMVKASDAQGHLRELNERIATLERQVRESASAPGEAKAAPPAVKAISPAPAPEPPPQPMPAIKPVWTHEAVEREVAEVSHAVPPPLPVAPPAVTASPKPAPVSAPAPVKKPVDWEQFMGAKLFAWVGAVALFIGVVFFVKYSFERNLI
ncbi:MAG: hypothetical protein WCD79_16975, partial [Chthoniobacteraceae bacterium]